MAVEKKTRGRQKLEMVKIAKESNLLVTFSKRRSGLFKKASELSTLCGAEIAVIIFSPTKKVFSFGHPNVERVVDRYLSQNPPQPCPITSLINAHRDAGIEALDTQYTQVMDRLEMETKKGKELARVQKTNMNRFWWRKPVEELDWSQIQQLKAAMIRLKTNVEEQRDILSIQHLFGYSSSSNQPVFPVIQENNEVFNPDMAFAPIFPNNEFGQINL